MNLPNPADPDLIPSASQLASFSPFSGTAAMPNESPNTLEPSPYSYQPDTYHPPARVMHPMPPVSSDDPKTGERTHILKKDAEKRARALLNKGFVRLQDELKKSNPKMPDAANWTELKSNNQFFGLRYNKSDILHTSLVVIAYDGFVLRLLIEYLASKGEEVLARRIFEYMSTRGTNGAEISVESIEQCL